MRARSLIGLDIGSRFIKALQLSELKGRFSITQFVRTEIPPGLSPADAVAELFTRRKFAGKRVVSAVSGKDVFVRFLSMAAADRDEMQTAAKYEIGKFIPVEADQVIHDSFTCEEGAIGADSRVVLAAAKRVLIDEHVALLETAGLQPVVVDVTAFALGNAYDLAGFAHPDAVYPGKVVAMVDIGATRTTLHILKDEVSYFTRELYKGCEDLAAAEVARETSVRRREQEPAGGTRVMENPSTKCPIIIVSDEDASKVRRRGGSDTETMPILMLSAEDAAKMNPIQMEGGGGDVPIVIVPEEDATKLRRSSDDSNTQSLPIIIIPAEDATKLRRRGDDTSSVKIPILIIDPEDATKLRRIEMEVREAGSMPAGAPVQELCSEILVSIEYFEAQHDLKVDRVLLTGGGSLFPDFAENLEELAKRPVSKWNAVDRMDQVLSDDARGELATFSAQAAIAFGLASRLRP